jgi:hypothetical protein
MFTALPKSFNAWPAFALEVLTSWVACWTGRMAATN